MKDYSEFKTELPETEEYMTEDVINEASIVKRVDIGANNEKTVSSIEKMLRAEAVEFFEGIHGVIVQLRSETMRGMNLRMDKKDLAKLSKMDIRWIEGSGGYVSIGLPNAKG